MKTTKLLTIIVLAPMLALSLSNCGNSSETGKSAPADDATAVTESTTPTPAATPEAQQTPTFAEGEWPDHEYTRQVPKPSMAIKDVDASGLTALNLKINFASATYDEVNAYRDELRKAGFNINENDVIPKSKTSIVWNAKNSEGWLVRLNYGKRGAGIQIQHP